MNKVMILGAGVYQLPLIKKAKELGIYTIVVSIPGDYPGFNYADKVYYINTTDIETVLAVAQKEQIDGITTCGTDVAIATIGVVCDAMGLKGISKEAAIKSCNKSLMKDALMEGGVRCAKGIKMSITDRLEEAKAICDSLTYPVVIKAVDSSGSRGITVVKCEDEIESAIESVKKVTRCETYLIEEFLSGDEIGADAFVLDGKVRFILPHGKYVYFAETGVPVGHYLPYENEEISRDTIEQVEKAILALGYDNCAVNADIMIHDEKAYVIEIGARAGATCIPELISIYQGYDYYEKILRAAMGEEVGFERIAEKSCAGAAKLLYSEEDGIVEKIEVPESDFIVYKELDVACGDAVQKFRLGPHRIGHIVTKGSSVKEASDRLEQVISDIVLERKSE